MLHCVMTRWNLPDAARDAHLDPARIRIHVASAGRGLAGNHRLKGARYFAESPAAPVADQAEKKLEVIMARADEVLISQGHVRIQRIVERQQHVFQDS